MLVTLGERGIKTLEDFADLASDELTDPAEGILREYGMSADEANDIIMTARVAAGWFTEEDLAAAAAAAAERPKPKPRTPPKTSRRRSRMPEANGIRCWTRRTKRIQTTARSRRALRRDRGRRGAVSPPVCANPRPKWSDLHVSPDGEVVPDISGQAAWPRHLGNGLTAAKSKPPASKDCFLAPRAAGCRRIRRCRTAWRHFWPSVAWILLGLARRGGGAVAGFDKVRAFIVGRRVGLLLAAADGAEDGRAKVGAA